MDREWADNVYEAAVVDLRLYFGNYVYLDLEKFKDKYYEIAESVEPGYYVAHYKMGAYIEFISEMLDYLCEELQLGITRKDLMNELSQMYDEENPALLNEEKYQERMKQYV